MEEQLSGACTVEIASFDEFTKLLGDPARDRGLRSHHLRHRSDRPYLASVEVAGRVDRLHRNEHHRDILPGAARRPAGAEGDLRLESPRAVAIRATTTLVLVSRPEQSALAEADRTRAELAEMGVTNQVLFLNGVFVARDRSDPAARGAGSHAAATPWTRCPRGLAGLPRVRCAAAAVCTHGVSRTAARCLTRGLPADTRMLTCGRGRSRRAHALAELVDEIEKSRARRRDDHGQGRSGQDHRRRGHRHRTGAPRAPRASQHHRSRGSRGRTVGGAGSRADRQPDRSGGRDAPLFRRGDGQVRPDLDEQGKALLEEDLRSPCTEEIAVFSAFAETVAHGEDGFVVLDTAPTGHTLSAAGRGRGVSPRSVAHARASMPEAVRNLLPRLRDPAFTRVLIVTLPEATPVHEAARLAGRPPARGHPAVCLGDQPELCRRRISRSRPGGARDAGVAVHRTRSASRQRRKSR